MRKKPLCRYCMERPVKAEWGNGFCSKDHAASFIIERFDNWYEWDEEGQCWAVSGTQSDEDDTGYDGE